MSQPQEHRPTDPVLVLEVILVLVLIAASVVLFWLPAGNGFFRPQWWTWIVLALIFFGILGLDVWRRRKRTWSGLHRSIREDAREMLEDEQRASSGRPRGPAS